MYRRKEMKHTSFWNARGLQSKVSNSVWICCPLPNVWWRKKMKKVECPRSLQAQLFWFIDIINPSNLCDAVVSQVESKSAAQTHRFDLYTAWQWANALEPGGQTPLDLHLWWFCFFRHTWFLIPVYVFLGLKILNQKRDSQLTSVTLASIYQGLQLLHFNRNPLCHVFSSPCSRCSLGLDVSWFFCVI